MRRGGRGSSLRGPWRRLDDAAIAVSVVPPARKWFLRASIPAVWESSLPLPIVVIGSMRCEFVQSAGSLNRGWTARNCVCITVLAACSLAMSILLWSSRHCSNEQQSNSSAMVFPLYQSYRSGGHGLGWRENRTARRRGIQGTDVLINVRGGGRVTFDDINPFYIEMKLGVPPEKYNFHIDTGSAITWVYCNIHIMVTKMTNWGPHGLFLPKDSSFLSCVGDTQALCLELQRSSSGEEPCDSSDNYRCLFATRYNDGSTCTGLFVNESFTVMMKDKSKRNLFGSFGCVTDRVTRNSHPLTTDGLIGLGNCKGSLLDQWIAMKVVKQSFLGVCLTKGVDWTRFRSPTTPVGYVSMGIDFKEKFHRKDSIWAKLISPQDTGRCALAVNLLYISIAGLVRTIQTPVFLDTGTGVTFLATSVFQLVFEVLEAYASLRGYVSVPDNRLYIASQQRKCWQPPDQILARGSPIKDFLPLVFAFEGIDSATQQVDFKYMVVDPANYLIWNLPKKKLCVTILGRASTSVIGADMMRGELFVYDIENQRVRWRFDDCKLN